MRRTKVAFFSDLLIKGFDGANRTMFEIINRVPRNKYEYFFICGEAHDGLNEFKVLDIPNVRIPFNPDYKMAMPALAYFKIKKALDKFRPDVIHIASPSLLGNFALEYGIPREIPIVSIYHTHFISYVDYYFKSKSMVSEMARSTVISGQRNFYNKCDLILVPTEEIMNELESHGFETNKMKIWQRGINHELFNPNKKDNKYIRQLAGNKNPNILFASRLVWEKNLSTLIEVYYKFEKEGNPVNFIIAGDGLAKSELEEKMPKAIFLGNVSQETLAKLYATADVFLFPSISETYGNVVVEAMASGCPCVIGKGGGSQSFVEQGVNGFLCSPIDANDYWEKINRILENESLRNQFIENGLLYTKGLNWASLVTNYLNEVDSLAEKAVVY